MTPNEIISKARGECRALNERAWSAFENFTVDGLCYYWCPDCGYCSCEVHALHVHMMCPDYSTDPSAWDSELYQWIEERGLVRKFFYHLASSLPLCDWKDEGKGNTVSYAWSILKSTPAQKAEALSKAIREVEGE